MKPRIQILELYILDPATLANIPNDIDGAYYLVHSMSSSKDYKQLEFQSAHNFKEAMNRTQVKHVVYLSGIINSEVLSEHLKSRKNVEEELSMGNYKLTTLRAGIIIGSGSASFEIIRDLVEKLPVMITPKWLLTKCQPIGVKDVITFLVKTLFNEKGYDKDFDIGGPDILTYKQMLEEFASVRNLKRRIYIVPVMTPKLSSYWLYFITATSYKLAQALVDSMKVEVVCRNSDINQILGVEPLGYQDALKRTMAAVEENQIVSSWKDAFSSGDLRFKLSDFVNVPTYGCYQDQRKKTVKDHTKSLDRIWQIGGSNGWYYANWLWKLRGYLDKLVGGVGLRRGRTNDREIAAGNAIDFWRVLYADKQEGRLLLFAEMKLPGEAWLEFRLDRNELTQTATFRPKGLWGRLYWFAVYPLHGLIFQGLINQLSDHT